MIKRLIGCVALLVTGPVEAQRQWASIGTGDAGAEWFFDYRNVKGSTDLLRRNFRRGWVKIDYSKDATQRARYQLAMYEVSCEDEDIGLVSAVFYAADGRILSSQKSGYVSRNPTVPDSLGESVVKVMCAVPIN